MSNFYMKEQVWNRLQNYSKYAYDEHKSEIGGMLLAEKDKEGKWKLHSPVILEQEISASNTALSKEALAAYYVKTAMKHKNRDIKFVWWHSHHTMDVFWSSTDLTAIDEMDQGDWSISLVVNLKQEYKLRVNVWKPYPAVVDDISLDIVRVRPEIPKNIITEIEKLCHKPKHTIYKPGSYIHNTQVDGQYRYGQEGQMTIFNDTALIQYEAKVDDMLVDYINGSIKYAEFENKVKVYNIQLENRGSNYRIAYPSSEEEFDTLSLSLEAEDYFHKKWEKWSAEDKLIERDAEEHDMVDINNAAWKV